MTRHREPQRGVPWVAVLLASLLLLLLACAVVLTIARGFTA